jgi:hypothetical protein
MLEWNNSCRYSLSAICDHTALTIAGKGTKFLTHRQQPIRLHGVTVYSNVISVKCVEFIFGILNGIHVY